MRMKITKVAPLLETLYHHVMRPALVASIDDPNSDWDDMALSLADSIISTICQYKWEDIEL